MTILITGKTGQIGHCLLEVAASRNLSVTALDRNQMDLANHKSIATTINSLRPTTVINTAAWTNVNGAEMDTDSATAVNANGAAHLAKVCNQYQIPIIHLSTDFVFDGKKSGPYLETDKTSPVNAYGTSKQQGENLVAQFNPQHIIIRTAWVHSQYGNNFVKTMLSRAIQTSSLEVVNDQTGNPTFGIDLAKALLDIAEVIQTRHTTDTVWGIYNITNLGSTTWFDLAQEVFLQSEKHDGPLAQIQPVQSTSQHNVARRPLNSRLDCKKIKKVFNISLPHWKSGVSRCVADILTNQPIKQETMR